MLHKIDHLIFAAPTLESGMDAIEKVLGISPVFGGQHLGRGTHNALLALGEKPTSKSSLPTLPNLPLLGNILPKPFG